MTLSWREVDCPTCGAKVKSTCRSKSGRPTYAHAARLAAGAALERPQPPSPPPPKRNIVDVHLP